MPSAPAPDPWAPAYRTLPPRAASLGDIAVDLVSLGGLELDEHQREAVDALQSIGPDGKWAMLEGAYVEPRQNGKSDGVLLPIALAAAVFVPDQLIVWSAHRYKTSHEAFLAMLKLFGSEDEPTELGKLVAKRSFSTGDEGFTFVNGSRIVFVARSQASGRGLSGDLVILDEALFLTGAMMGALFPTLSARPNPLVLYASSAGLATSAILRDIRDRGREGDPSLVYLEHCAPQGGCAAKGCDHAKSAEGCAADDTANWRAANKAVHAGRMTVEYIAAERRALPVQEFLRERMGWWEEAGRGGLFHLPTWWKRQSKSTTPGTRVSFALHVTPDRSKASVAVASVRGDGVLHLELLDHRDGVSWLAPWLTNVCREFKPQHLAIAGSMAAGALAADLEKLRGFNALNSTEVRRACAGLYDLVNAEGQVEIRVTDPDLNAVLETAASAARRSTERGEWVFDADPEVDLSPLYALALVAHVVRGKGPKKSDAELLASAH